jgi:AraC-like DNA-binding protein
MVETVELPGSYAYELVALCARWSIDSAAILEGTGLTLQALKDPATRLSLPTCAALVARARELTREPALAFMMGLQMRVSWHGFLGFAAMTAATVREALEVAEHFSLTRTSAFGLSSYVEGDTAALVLEERADLGALREFAVITLLVGIARIARDATGGEVRGVAECAFPAPDYAARVLERAGRDRASMLFDRPSHRLVFQASTLDLPIVTADPVATQLARAQCDRELAALTEGGSFVGKVRALVSRGDDGTRSLDEVARRLHVSTRTLKRRLADQGTSFSAILEGVRHQRALLLLGNRQMGLADVAGRLGYSDVANFARAFRRWTGQTPAAYRAR